LKIKENSQAKSSVLSFDINKDISIKYVYNLFSNFGNISFITKKNSKRMYIKFRTMEFAAIAFTYLNEYYLMGNLLKLESPEYAEEASPKESEYC
jgi:RNA recognition motif-containing protein